MFLFAGIYGLLFALGLRDLTFFLEIFEYLAIGTCLTAFGLYRLWSIFLVYQFKKFLKNRGLSVGLALLQQTSNDTNGVQ